MYSMSEPMTKLTEKIESLKKARDAVILAHNYQRGEVQDIADYVGDSLGLARTATELECEWIVFCGVDFMAESAAVLNPDKVVVLPERDAECPMAMMATAEQVRAAKQKLEDCAVVAYVNTLAEVKAEADICCTSANSIQVVNSLDHDEVLFVPDRNLALWTQRHTKKHIIPWNGYCPTHHQIMLADVLFAKQEHPDALVMVHPECRPEVCDVADVVTSTSGMIRYAEQSEAREFIVGTEVGLLHGLKKRCPQKRFYPASEYAVCPNMKMTTLESIIRALESGEHRIKVEKSVQKGARRALERMLEL
ncbi:MAG: quinolinate synthase [Methanosarcinales archaeon]|nr:quinolinate synthase [Methanosarcinales archaeon]MDN5294866.1 quinolinate synthase [Methanosarcinales archaeon]